jgi:hypothetical protein
MIQEQMYAKIRPVAVTTDPEYLWVTLKDGRIIGTPLAWYPWLLQASESQRAQFELLPDGVYWSELDEGLEVEGMLQGLRPVIHVVEPVSPANA